MRSTSKVGKQDPRGKLEAHLIRGLVSTKQLVPNNSIIPRQKSSQRQTRAIRQESLDVSNNRRSASNDEKARGLVRCSERSAGTGYRRGRDSSFSRTGRSCSSLVVVVVVVVRRASWQSHFPSAALGKAALLFARSGATRPAAIIEEYCPARLANGTRL